VQVNAHVGSEVTDLPALPRAIQEAIRASRDAGEVIAVTGFGENGSGGLGFLYEDRFVFVDRRATWGVVSAPNAFLRLVSHSEYVSTEEGARLPTALEVTTATQPRRTLVFAKAPRLYGVCCNGDDVYVTTGRTGEVLRCSLKAVSSPVNAGADHEVTVVSSFGDEGRSVIGVGVVSGRTFAAVSSPENHAGGGELVDLLGGHQIAGGLTSPADAVRWGEWWLISDVAAKALVMIHDDGHRHSIALGGVCRGVMVAGDSALVLVGRPRVLLTAEDRKRYRLVAVDLVAREVEGEVVLPLARLFGITGVPVDLASRLLEVDSGNQCSPPSTA